MFARPIVAGTVTGILLGQIQTGLVVGALVELFWIDRSQIGTIIPPNDTMASIIIAAATILTAGTSGHAPRELIALAVLLFIPLGLLGRQVDILIMGFNEKLSREAVEEARSGRETDVLRKISAGLIKAYLFNLCFLLGLIFIATEVLRMIYPVLPPKLFSQLTLIYCFLPLLGTAVALSTVNMKGEIPVFCGAFLSLLVLMDVF